MFDWDSKLCRRAGVSESWRSPRKFDAPSIGFWVPYVGTSPSLWVPREEVGPWLWTGGCFCSTLSRTGCEHTQQMQSASTCRSAAEWKIYGSEIMKCPSWTSPRQERWSPVKAPHPLTTCELNTLQLASGILSCRDLRSVRMSPFETATVLGKSCQETFGLHATAGHWKPWLKLKDSKLWSPKVHWGCFRVPGHFMFCHGSCGI